MKNIIELNFTDKDWHSKISTIQDLIPVSLLINNKYFVMSNYSSWIEFLKIFYFEALKCKDVYNFVNKNLNIKMFNNKNLIFSSSANSFKKEHTKIATNVYLRVYESKPLNNLVVIKRVLASSLLDCRIFLGSYNDVKLDEFKKEQKELKESILNQNNKPKIVYKSVGHYIANINAKIFNEYEKFINDFHKKFKSKIFIGDIVLNDHDEDIFDKYMKYEMNRISKNNFNIYDEELFSYGLVRYAMKYYGKSFTKFWPYVKQEYNIPSLNASQQTNINRLFEETMKKNNKKYYSGSEDAKGNKKIDNISMHTFITDHFANQLFDYLFEFWRLDLERNIDNLDNDSAENGISNMDILIDEIKQNNKDDENPNYGIKRHTAMAVETNTRGCKTRFRNILNIIHNSFWNYDTKISSHCRIYKLLEKWMNDKDSLFQKEYDIDSYTRKAGKGEQLYSKPVINFDYNENLILKLPRQMIKNYSSGDEIYWKIIIGDNVRRLSPELLQGKIRIYALQKNMILNNSDIFKKIECQLWQNDTICYSATIRKDSMRIISDKQYFVENYEKGFKEGRYFIFTLDDNIPYLIGEDIKPYKKDDLYVTQYCLEDGDALILPNDTVVQIGKKLEPGLFGIKPIKGVHSTIDNDIVEVYNKLPKIMFKAEEHQIPGTSITINNDIYHIEQLGLKKLYINDESNYSYGYMVDLSSLNLGDDIYKIGIKVPLSNVHYEYNFIYIRDFNYEFIGAPYIFKDRGTIEFKGNFNFKKDIFDKQYYEKFNLLKYEFVYDENSMDCDVNVNEKMISFTYLFNDQNVILQFDIPALYWKYDLSKKHWNVAQPSYISRKKIPEYLYLSGPFDFEKCVVNLNIDNFEQDSFIEPQITTFKDVFKFKLDNINSWITEKYDCDYLDIELKNNTSKMLFTKLICRSIVRSSQLFGDMNDKCIYGSFDIDGASEYSVTVKYNEEIIGEDIPLTNNQFIFEYDFTEGTYEVYLYEIVEDDNGFDSYTFLLKNYTLKLINPNDLSKYTLKLIDIRHIDEQLKPLSMCYDYYITNIKKEDFTISKNIDLISLDKVSVDDEEAMKKFTYYSGTLIGKKYNKEFIFNKVLMIFYDRYNISNYYLLCKSEIDNQYYPFLYNTETHELLLDSDGTYQNRDKLLATLFITDFAFESIMEEK